MRRFGRRVLDGPLRASDTLAGRASDAPSVGRVVVFLAEHAWRDRYAGDWPKDVPSERRSEYDRRVIKRWLTVFLHRFFETNQFKRSALPNAPKVGSGGSLSPRSDWRAPSDSHADAWLQELEREVPEA